MKPKQIKQELRIEDITNQNVAIVSRLEKATIETRTTAERIADFVAEWVGSWTFLIVQSGILAAWVVVNASTLVNTWDPYPFVLLNLVLSFEAAFTTPIILMSENRQMLLSDRRHQLDLQVNLLAERENTEQLRLLRLLCMKAGIDLANTDVTPLAQEICPDKVMQQIVEHEREQRTEGP